MKSTLKIVVTLDGLPTEAEFPLTPEFAGRLQFLGAQLKNDNLATVVGICCDAGSIVATQEYAKEAAKAARRNLKEAMGFPS